MIRATLLLLVLTIPAAAQVVPRAVLPGLGTSPARAPVDIRQAPWRGVVRVQTEIGARCTGALVGPALVLTAAHCVFGRGTGRVVRPGSIHVLAGFDRGQFDGHARAAALEIGPGFALGPDGQPAAGVPADSDWAALRLDAPLGSPDRALLPLSAIPPPGTRAALPGFEQDRAEILLADTGCTVVGTTDGGRLLQHSCAGTRGASGAPLLVRDAAGAWRVAGIATAARVGAAGGVAIPIGTITARSRLLAGRP